MSGTVLLSISTNEVDFSTDGPRFTFHEPPRALSLQPQQGVEVGGTAITVSGSGFVRSAHLLCRFGDSAAPVLAEWLGPESLKCVAPPHDPGDLSLKISVDGQAFTSNGLLFSDVPLWSGGTIEPDHGPTHGSTQVTLRGSSFPKAFGSLSLRTVDK